MAGGRGKAREGARKRTRKSRVGEAPARDLTELEAEWLGSQLAMRRGTARVANGAENPVDIPDAAPELSGGAGTPEPKDTGQTRAASQPGTADDPKRPKPASRWDSFWRFG